MLATVTSSLLFFFITWNLGYGFEVFLSKNKKIECRLGFFEIFLLGIVISYVYFTISSFFIPLNYKVLAPLLLIALFISGYYKTFNFLFQSIFSFTQEGKKVKKLFLYLLLITLFIYSIVPPINADSGAYHYLTIKWYENFKGLPGLSNIHGRFGFNPASFTISAPYCLTGVFGQSIYSVNGVLIFIF